MVCIFFLTGHHDNGYWSVKGYLSPYSCICALTFPPHYTDQESHVKKILWCTNVGLSYKMFLERNSSCKWIQQLKIIELTQFIILIKYSTILFQYIFSYCFKSEINLMYTLQSFKKKLDLPWIRKWFASCLGCSKEHFFFVNLYVLDSPKSTNDRILIKFPFIKVSFIRQFFLKIWKIRFKNLCCCHVLSVHQSFC